MDWEPINYLIIFLITSREQSTCTFLEETQKSSYIHSSIQTKKEEKNLKDEAAESYLEPCQISITERFCIIYVWYGSKYTPEVMQDSKINLNCINSKMLEKTVYFFNVDLVDDIPT